jgi:hypothetical protein
LREVYGERADLDWELLAKRIGGFVQYLLCACDQMKMTAFRGETMRDGAAQSL